MLTKQQLNPYIWDDKIKIKTKDGKYDYEIIESDEKEETNQKVLKKNLQK